VLCAPGKLYATDEQQGCVPALLLIDESEIDTGASRALADAWCSSSDRRARLIRHAFFHAGEAACGLSR